MDISQYEILITKHALFRAYEKGIDADTIEKIVANCEKQSFGKHYARWTKKLKNIEIICIGYIENNEIRILTVETK